ncbi:MAG: hypothetical protein RQ826_04565 [Xanthomonadales bacterium]|nr:hypothetical protein [Xanthomonadales bacterium]
MLEPLFRDHGANKRFAGVHFRPGQYLYADLNGVVVADGLLGMKF